MRLFGPIYDRCRAWAGHRLAARYLFWMSVAESVFFPIPVDVMLAPMALATPSRWVRLGVLCTVGSVLGGVVGYALGALALDAVWPLMLRLGWDAKSIAAAGAATMVAAAAERLAPLSAARSAPWSAARLPGTADPA